MKSPYKSLFLFLMVMSTCMVLSSSTWLMTWMGLEINMLGFIPLMYLEGTTNESETATKYLVPQALGSTIFIASAMTTLHSNNFQILMPIALCLKLGAAPLHFWFPPVMASLPLLPTFLLLTWQKIAPIFAIASLPSTLSAKILPIAAISALWGGIAGVNQTDIRSLLTYSSIAHTGWMLASIDSSAPTLTLYLTTYILITVSIYLCLIKQCTESHKQLFSFKEPYDSLLLIIALLSLSGLPPLTGFMMKLLVLYFTKASTMIILTLILGAMTSLLYYLSLTLSPLSHTNKLHFSKLSITAKASTMFLLSQLLPLSLIIFFF
uniref:NADH-ubiquinone oxidoreductase chain 2 n=1 Tax=Potamilus streckersoni TaxID=2493646 RepID=A0A7U0IUS0_9BIVA|nr:NADH dehydrogenase subunit 2 [Potamilus streckersoni]QQV68438.1 NADH dehydrogenase subunit 2 [Potamilus streckersoni]UUA64270.1 NADH dehydrogenase subunit 2 [Potamilus streckersoni]